MVYIGIDPSVTNTGIVLLNGGNPYCYKIEWVDKKGGYYATRSRDGRIQAENWHIHAPKEKSELGRIGGLYWTSKKILDSFQIDFGTPIRIGIERPMGNNISSAALMGMAYASIMLGIYYRKTPDFVTTDIEITAYTPTELKKFITGKGNAKKQIIIQQVYKKYGIEFEDDNLADAFVLAKMAEAAHAGN